VSNDLKDAEQKLAKAEVAVASARTIVADLEAKREATRKRGAELADERSNVALAAHTGDQEAAARLEAIHAGITRHGSELASLDAAVLAAQRKVAEAQATVATETKKLNGIKLHHTSRAFTSHLRNG
jgi:chromosome segregation ATPase